MFFLSQTNNHNFSQAAQLFSEITFNKLLLALIIIVSTYAGLWIIDKIINWLSEQVALRFRLSVKQSLPFWRAFIFGLSLVLLINLFLNLSANNLLAITGTAAVAIGFAFKDYVSSIIAGIIGLFEGPYQVGDRVKIGEHYGEIISYGLRGIMLRTPNDDIVTIPHNKIWTEAIVNANKGSVEAQTIVDFYFAHGVNVEQVIHILYRVAHTSKYTQLKLPILVIMEEKPWGTHFKLKCYPIDARDEFLYQTDLIKRTKQAVAKCGVIYPVLPTQEL
jgi:small-conductance mechanosensitive channel